MNTTTPTPEERLDALDRLLLMYAMTVRRMRELQKELTVHYHRDELKPLLDAEAEVDTLTELHLLPSINTN